MKLYPDSNVLISYLRSEIDSSFNLRFLDSEKFFIACRVLKAELVISELFLAEINKKIKLGPAAVKELFTELGIAVLFTGSAEKSVVMKIMHQTGVHFDDAMHIANAFAAGCNCIITWNMRDFKKAAHIVPCKNPADFTEGL